MITICSSVYLCALLRTFLEVLFHVVRGSKYIPVMYVKSFYVSLCGREPSRTNCVASGSNLVRILVNCTNSVNGNNHYIIFI